jgi:chromosome segregation ATPase
VNRARETIARASESFQDQKGREVSDIVMENERLKTTLMIMNQRLKDHTDSQDQIAKLKRKNEEFYNLASALQKENQSLKSQNSSLESQVASLQQTIDQMDSNVKELKTELERSEEQRRYQRTENFELNEKIIQIEEECYGSKTIQLDLLEQLKTLDGQLHIAQKKIEELLDINQMLENNQAVYIAKKHDKIDNQLAKFINQYPEREKMRILFLRESEGVYQFGQRRVYIKIEKGDQILVRVGGGFMHISEFIDAYTPSEVDKIERKDTMSRFQQKLVAQRISITQSVNRTESSPVASPQRPAACTNGPNKENTLQKSLSKKRVRM